MITVIDLHSGREVQEFGNTILGLGNFDGVHLGHRRLIDAAVKKKKELSATFADLFCGVFFFRDPPSEILGGVATPQITTLEEKLTLFADAGLDYAFVADFPALMNLDPKVFVRDVLKARCHCLYAVCGYNFSFGKQAAGHSDTLCSLMEGNALVVDCVQKDGLPVSSSRIRALLCEGDVAAAKRLLGHPYAFESLVVHGKHLGNRLGFPTVNQNFPEKLLIPKRGIYATAVCIDGLFYPAVTNIGLRPTVEPCGKINCETHIIGYDGDLYGRSLAVEFIDFIREEKKFDNVDALIGQIRKDALLSKTIFEKTK